MSSKKRRQTAAAQNPKGELLVDLGAYEAAVVGFADTIVIQPRDDVVEMAFLESSGRQSAIMVARFYITYADLTGVWQRSSDFYETMKVMPDRNTWGKYEIESTLPSRIVGGDNPAALCSVISVAKIAEAALVECYYFTATSIHRVSKGAGTVKVVPLFAIQLPAGLTWSFFSRIRDLVSSHIDGIVKE